MRIETNQDLYDAIGSYPGGAKVQVVLGDRYIDVVQVNRADGDSYQGIVVLQLDESHFELEAHVTGLKFKD